MDKKTRIIAVCAGGIGYYLLHFPLRFLEDWVMGWMEAEIAENLLGIIGFSIVWVLPFLIVFTAIWLGYRLRGSRQSPVAMPSNGQAELNEADKQKITDLMESVNVLEDRMNRFFNEALYHKGNRVKKYQSLLDSLDIKELWDRCSSQRAIVSTISPELEEQVRLLITLIPAWHRTTLKEWYMSQLPILKQKTDEHLTAIESIKKAIKHTIKELIG